MISVVVGKDEAKDTFVIEEPLLTDASPYFKNALQTTFKEGFENRVELEEEDPAIFGLLNEYIHIGGIWQKRYMAMPHPQCRSTVASGSWRTTFRSSRS